MYDITARVAAWLDQARTVHIAQVVASAGFSSSEPGAAYAWTDDGEQDGALLPGLSGMLTESGGQLDGHLVEVTISDSEAVSAGLSCGGTATLFVQNAAEFPADTWTRLERREPVCLVSEIVGSDRGTTALYTAADVRDAPQHPDGVDVARLFARGVTATALTTGHRSQIVVALWPSTELVVVGGGAIATALADSATLLGWAWAVTDDVTNAVKRIEQLTASDAVVVLSHDRPTDVPALAAALTSRVGYVGALGSRGTQAARRDALTVRGVTADQLARVHGPAGLDIDAHTPAEIAVSIVAEILASRSGGTGASISSRGGPVHTGGVHAPPPRN
jgi:xanthine dehydrogenase accessory factor